MNRFKLTGKSLLTLNEFSTEELDFILTQASELKEKKRNRVFDENLKHRNICGIFLKPSARTSTSFVVACADEAASLEFFPAENIRFGYKESVKDIAKLLGRNFDGIAFRGFDHTVAEDLARYSGIPVWNGLTDDHHPTQLLADVLTMQEEFGELAGLQVAYVGDGRNNVATSLAIGALKLGYHLRIVSPESLLPSATLVAQIKADTPESWGSISFTSSIEDGVKDAAVIYTDVWVSMGEEDKIEQRINSLKAYKITQQVLDMTGRKDTIFLHCLPAFHDLETEVARNFPDIREVDDEVFTGPQSRVFEQAENRMHTIKSLMIATIN